MSRAELVAALADGRGIYCAACAMCVVRSKVDTNLGLVLDMGCLLCGANDWKILTPELLKDPRFRSLDEPI